MYEVLIVEDDPMVAMINKQYVTQNENFHVSGICRDGISAFEYIKAHTVQLVILDVYMPRGGGMMLLRKIREHNLPISVIMVTAANDGATIDEALRLGIVDYLVKPFTNTRFNQALDTFVKRHAAFTETVSFSQQRIDELISGGAAPAEPLPKGIQEQTLKLICEFLQMRRGRETTGEAAADAIGLSRVTVRRYMNYLLERDLITGRMNYETGGRPSMMYKWND